MANPAASNSGLRGKGLWTHTVPQILNYIVIILAFGLIIFISWDTNIGVDYLEDSVYMEYQFAVCMVFIAEYIYRLVVSKHKLRFVILAMPFLFVSIPWLNLISFFHVDVSAPVLHFLCSVPLFRGLFALILVVNYLTKTLSATLFFSYLLVMIPIVYMSGLFFYVAEKDINTSVKSLWYALWWAGMNVTTIGCYINPLTTAGMIIGFILSLLGLIMLPLFTVYCGDALQLYSKKMQKLKV